MTKHEQAVDLKRWLLLYTKNFLSFIWTDGSHEGVLIFFERYGNRYGKDNVILLREYNLLTLEEEALFFEFEEALFEQLEKKHPFYICFTSDTYEKIEAARKKIIKHFNIDIDSRSDDV